MNLFKIKFPWELFFEEKIKKIFTEKKLIIDIGGGLRVDPAKNNRKKENHWIDQYLKNVDYKILDKVADYNPDIVGDIHDLPLKDESVDAVICMNILEHVEDPQKAIKEMHRVLKKGGYLYLDTPFIFYYHPMKGYYKDYFRFTRDAWEYMARDFRSIEIQNVRGAISTSMNMFSFFSKRTYFFDLLDILFKKQNSNQTSAYRVFCIK
ncbi:MAG: methyltransferase domain-containing protein [Patescibacteria group bacterium]